MHAVSLGLGDRVAGTPTASTTRPSLTCNKNFTVPSAVFMFVCITDLPILTPISFNLSLSVFGIFIINFNCNLNYI